jgi:hypothetical protein
VKKQIYENTAQRQSRDKATAENGHEDIEKEIGFFILEIETIPVRSGYPVMYPYFLSSGFPQISPVERRYRAAEETSARQTFGEPFRSIYRANFQAFLHNVEPMGYVDQL